MKPLNYYDLLDAFAESGCPVCRLLHADGDRFLDLFFHENVMDFEVQDTIRAARLMCNPHAWQMLTFRGRATDIAVLTELALEAVIRRTDGASSFTPRRLQSLLGQPPGTLLADELEPTQPCLCCAHLDRIEHNYLETVAGYLGNDPMQEAYRVSDGLCLPHFRRLLREIRDPAVVKMVTEVQVHLWGRLREELNLFLERTRQGYEGEPLGAEANSWMRAVQQLVGERQVFGMQRKANP